ncbi:MAG: flagellar hook assembly protein FlgD [Candidatus Poribacteria bacterium]
MNSSSIFATQDIPGGRLKMPFAMMNQNKINRTDAMNQEDFLKLLMAQMKNQNPLEPMDNQEFIAQLTSFSSLEQLENLNQKVSSSVQLQKSQSSAAAMSLIGKKIKAPGDIIELNEKTPVDISYELESDANVTINIYDNNNKLVKTINAGIQKAGANNLAWDGTTTSGKKSPEGIYTYEVVSTGPDGEAVSAKTFLFGQVEKIQFENGGASLFVGNREVNLSDVYTVSD